MAKIKYKIKDSSTDKKVIKKKLVTNEETLKELLSVLPTLKKHKMSENIETKVKQLRSGRKARSFNLQLSREFFFTEVDEEGKVTKKNSITVEAPVEKATDKYAVLRALKEKLIKELKQKRKNMRPVPEQKGFGYDFNVPYMDMVYLESGSIMKAMFKKIRVNMVKDKRPNDKSTRYVGVEIELAAKETRDEVCDAIFAAGIGKHICIKNDGSIGSEAHAGVKSTLKDKHPHAHEICVLAKESEIEDVINKLCKVLNEVLHVAVDKTCGLHVHFDMRTRDHKIAFNNLVLSQQFLYAMLPAQRRNSKYSFPVKGTEFKESLPRYHGINPTAYSKYQTLELRMHCGTTNANKINNWIKLGVALCDAPKFKNAPVTIEAFKAYANLSDSIVEYVKARIAKFADQHKKNIPSAEEPGSMPDLDMKGLTAPVDENPIEDSEVA